MRHLSLPPSLFRHLSSCAFPYVLDFSPSVHPLTSLLPTSSFPLLPSLPSGPRLCPAEREASSLVHEYLGREALPDIGEEGSNSSSNSSSSSSSSPVQTLGESIAEEEEEEEADEEAAAKAGEGREGGAEEEGDRFADLDDGGRENFFDDGEEGKQYAVEIEGL